MSWPHNRHRESSFVHVWLTLSIIVAGLYEELRRIEPDFAFCPRDNVDQRAFIVLGFKTLDTTFSEVLEATWRDWTGARAIYLRLHNQFDLSK